MLFIVVHETMKNKYSKHHKRSGPGCQARSANALRCSVPHVLSDDLDYWYLNDHAKTLFPAEAPLFHFGMNRGRYQHLPAPDNALYNICNRNGYWGFVTKGGISEAKGAARSDIQSRLTTLHDSSEAENREPQPQKK